MVFIITEDDRLASETREDQWFEQPRDELAGLVRYAENAVSANSSDWCRADTLASAPTAAGSAACWARSSSRFPRRKPDYYDAIQQWAARAGLE